MDDNGTGTLWVGLAVIAASMYLCYAMGRQLERRDSGGELAECQQALGSAFANGLVKGKELGQADCVNLGDAREDNGWTRIN